MSKFSATVSTPVFGEFDDLYARMVTIVKGLKGYISHKVFTAEDGESSDYYFSDLKLSRNGTLTLNTNTPKNGAKRMFTEYDVIVAKVVEHHSKPAKPGADRFFLQQSGASWNRISSSAEKATHLTANIKNPHGFPLAGIPPN